MRKVLTEINLSSPYLFIPAHNTLLRRSCYTQIKLNWQYTILYSNDIQDRNDLRLREYHRVKCILTIQCINLIKHLDLLTTKSFSSQISPAGTFYNISPNVLFRIKFRNVQHLFSTHFTLQ